MLSQTSEYALRAVVHLAGGWSSAGEPVTVEAVARATRIPISYLAKIMQQLSRAGLATSQRGLHGGFALSRDPAMITLFDVIHAVDPFQRIASCPMGIPEHRDGLCSLHRELDDTLAAIEGRLRATTIADVLSSGIRPLCPPPRPDA